MFIEDIISRWKIIQIDNLEYDSGSQADILFNLDRSGAFKFDLIEGEFKWDELSDKDYRISWTGNIDLSPEMGEARAYIENNLLHLKITSLLEGEYHIIAESVR